MAIVTNAGGPGILAADACAANGLEVPELLTGDAARAAQLRRPGRRGGEPRRPRRRRPRRALRAGAAHGLPRSVGRRDHRHLRSAAGDPRGGRGPRRGPEPRGRRAQAADRQRVHDRRSAARRARRRERPRVPLPRERRPRARRGGRLRAVASRPARRGCLPSRCASRRGGGDHRRGDGGRRRLAGAGARHRAVALLRASGGRQPPRRDARRGGPGRDRPRGRGRAQGGRPGAGPQDRRRRRAFGPVRAPNRYAPRPARSPRRSSPTITRRRASWSSAWPIRAWSCSSASSTTRSSGRCWPAARAARRPSSSATWPCASPRSPTARCTRWCAPLKTFPLLDGYRGAPKADVAALEDVLLRISELRRGAPRGRRAGGQPADRHRRRRDRGRRPRASAPRRGRRAVAIGRRLTRPRCGRLRGPLRRFPGWHEAHRRLASQAHHQGDPMPTRVAINGFGRIGRAVLRAAVERDADLEIVAVNDVADPATLAHLLARDSVYGRFPAERASPTSGTIVVGDRDIEHVTGERRSRRAAVARARRRRRHRVHRALPHARGRRAGTSTPARARSSSPRRPRAASRPTPTSCSA